MWRKSVLAVLVILLLGPAWSASAALVGWWTFDETSGTIAHDSSGSGNDGTVVGTPMWVPGKIGGAFQFNGSTYINCGRKPSLNIRNQITMAFWFKVAAFSNTWEAFLAKSDGAYRASRSGGTGNSVHMGISGSNYFDATPVVTDNLWHHYCGTYDGATAIIYLDGKEVQRASYTGQIGDSSSYDLYIGENSGATGRLLHGLLDDVQIYDNALKPAEIQKIMTGLGNKAQAKDGIPADGATDVPRDASLSWTAGEYPATHDVYLGTVFADVNSASRAAPNSLLASQGQADPTFTPASVFVYGQTYYWRIDEVNKSAEGTVNKGKVWSFTAEPYAYPITKITATASSAQLGSGPENTVNGSGLDKNDLHGTDGSTMWLSTSSKDNWIQYQFDAVYKLYELKVWNSNESLESFIGFGAKDVKIEYSTDGTTWTTLANVPQFAQAAGLPGYAANTTVSLAGVMAQYVKLTILSNWGGISPVVSLSEVRFTYVPVQARAPQPAPGATGVAVRGALTWRPGREAGSHKVFFGTDPNAVANGTAAAKTVTAHSFDPGALLFGTTYYWKVDEVNTTTYPGVVWSFTTQEYAMVDDFEAYDQDANRLYDAWIDGSTDGKSNSFVGYNPTQAQLNTGATFAETTIVHGGKQSMPVTYDNSKAPFLSEANRTFATAQDWTTNGADTLSLWFRGRAAAFLDNGDGTYSMSSSGTDVWNNSDQFRFAYKTLSGDGSMVVCVDSVANTNVWAKAGVMIRQSIDPASTNVYMPIDPGGASAGNGASWQYRLTVGGASANAANTGAVVAPPYWVKVTRAGSSFSGYISPDGKTWTQLGTAQTINMTNPVLIGLAVTSHDATLTTVAQFSNLATTGTVTGSWQVAAIGMDMTTNDPAPLYLAVQDKAGKSKTVVNPTPAASVAASWTQWQIAFSSLSGVSLTSVQQLTLGVGDKTSPKAGGAGLMFFDDIGYGHPAQ